MRYMLQQYPGSSSWSPGRGYLEKYLGTIVRVLSGPHGQDDWMWPSGYMTVISEVDGNIMDWAPECLVPIDDANEKIEWGRCEWQPGAIEA